MQSEANASSLAPLRLGRYWLAVGIWLVILGIYIGTIRAHNAETARRSTAPPWFSWVRYPPTRTRPQAIFLVVPVIVYAGWIAFVRRSLNREIGSAIFLAGACLMVFAMNSAIAMMDGGASFISKPFDLPGSEYYWDVHWVNGVRNFLSTYTHDLYKYSIHTRTHPPGAVLLLYFLSRTFGPSLPVAGWSAVAITATGVIPAYILASRIADARIARIAVALYAVTPSLVLFGATSMDGVFLPFLLWAMVLLHQLIHQPGPGIGIVTGIWLAICFMFTYLTACVLVLMGIHAIFVLWNHRPSIAPVIRAMAFATLVVVLCYWLLDLTTGFNLIKCYQASRFYDHYAMRTFSISFPRYLDISFSNLFAFLIGIGFSVFVLWIPATFQRVQKNEAGRFNVAVIITIVLFSFARLFTHETERIWLCFIPPVLIAPSLWIAQQKKDSRKLLEWTMGLLFMQTWAMQLLLYTMW